MGDFRAECHIRLNLMGKDYNFDADWINWSADDDGMDYHVRAFFREAWADTEARHAADLYEARLEEREKSERREYERLRAKYEN